MSLAKRAACLVLCILLVFSLGSAAFAAETPSVSTEFFERYDGLMDGVVDSLQELKDGKGLQVSASLSEKLKQYDLSTLGPDLKALVSETEQLSDAELDAAIRAVAAEHNIPLTDSQVQQLHDVCRGMEKLSAQELQEKADKIKDRVDQVNEGLEKLEQGKEKLEQGKEKLEQRKEKAAGLFGRLKQFVQTVADRIRNIFGKVK